MLVSESVNSKSTKVPEWSFTGENARAEAGCSSPAKDCFQCVFILCVSRLTGTKENTEISSFHVSRSIVRATQVCRCRSRWPWNKEELGSASTPRALLSHREWLAQDGISQICLEFRLCHMGSDKMKCKTEFEIIQSCE